MATTLRQPANPLSRVALAVPAAPALAVSVAARLLGAAFAVAYAHNQDTLFPTRHFPRTWTLVAVVAAVALLSCVPWERVLGGRARLASFTGALGCGVLVFGGAQLGQRTEGMVVFVAGAIGWLAFAASNHARGGSTANAVSGLFMGSLVTFLVVAVAVFVVPS